MLGGCNAMSGVILSKYSCENDDRYNTIFLHICEVLSLFARLCTGSFDAISEVSLS